MAHYRIGETRIRLAVQFGQTEEFFGPLGSKFDHRHGWAATRIFLKRNLQVFELQTQHGAFSVHRKDTERVEQTHLNTLKTQMELFLLC